jgi:trimeric autotransporter adhesin
MASNTYRMPGISSAASLAAQSGPTAFVTTDASGNLAASNFGPQNIAGLTANVATLQQGFNTLQQGFNMLQENLQHGLNQAYEGTAVAIALSGSALPDTKRFAVTTNWGNFRGTNAMSFIAQARISDNIVANAAIASGFQYGGVGTRAGMTFAW